MGHGTTSTYVIGFVLSMALTLGAYILVIHHVLQGAALVAAIIGAAIIQLLVQLRFFLHLGKESKPKWNLIAFLFMLMVLVILVFGSLWIMNNLNYHNMTPEQTESHIEHEEGIHQ